MHHYHDVCHRGWFIIMILMLRDGLEDIKDALKWPKANFNTLI